MIVNIETFTDADYSQGFSYQTALFTPIDITGKTLHLMARVTADDPTVFLELDSLSDAGGIEITDAALGAFMVFIPESFLVTMPVGTYVHSLIMSDPVTFSRTDIWRGTLTHADGPTRWKPGTP